MAIVDMPIEKLRKYKPKLTKEKDFDKFWKETLAESKRQPLNIKMERVDYPVKRLEAYKVFYNGFNGGRMCGLLLKEKGAKKTPGLLSLHGYSGHKGVIADYLSWVYQGYTVFTIDVRGQSGESGDGARYEGGHVWGWMTQGILNPKEYYYRLVYMDCVRALDVLCAQKEVDLKRIAVTGGSQGGGLTLAVCALDPRPKIGAAWMPFLCHFGRGVEIAENPYKEILGFMKQHPETEDRVFKTLSYVDNMNLAGRIKARMHVSVGMQDIICPPSTIFAAFNHLKCKKDLVIYKYAGHEGIGVHGEDKLKWMAKYI